MKSMDIIFVGAIFVIIGGVIGAIGTRMQNKASSAKSDKQLSKIQELNEQNIKLINSLTTLSSQNSTLSNNVSNLSEQNSKLILELSNARKDVDKARLESLDNTFGSMGGVFVQGESYLKLYNESKLPMYDVKIFITNYDSLLDCDKMNDHLGELAIKSSCYHKLTKQYSSPIIYGETVVDFPELIVDPRKTYRIIAKIITKKGTYYQQLINSNIKGLAYRILEQENPGDYWNQFLNIYNVQKKLPNIKQETFRVVKEKVFGKYSVDWNKEFPLPVSFSLVD